MNRFPAPQVPNVSAHSMPVRVHAAQGGGGCWAPCPGLRQRAGLVRSVTAREQGMVGFIQGLDLNYRLSFTCVQACAAYAPEEL